MISKIDIWQPKYSTKECLVLASRIISDKQQCRIYFTADKSLKGNTYLMTGAQIKEHGPLKQTDQGGKKVYAIPMDILDKFKETE
jgi:hypothetical protein